MFVMIQLSAKERYQSYADAATDLLKEVNSVRLTYHATVPVYSRCNFNFSIKAVEN